MADPTKLARRWLDPGPQAGMPAAVDASAIEDADALPRFQTHLGDMAQIVELRPDTGHGPVGDDHTDAGPRLTGRGTGDGVEGRRGSFLQRLEKRRPQLKLPSTGRTAHHPVASIAHTSSARPSASRSVG